MINDEDITIDKTVKAAKLLTVWSRLTRTTVSIQKELYDELQMRVTPLMAGVNSENGNVELVVMARLKAISDLKSRFRLFEKVDYDPVLRGDTPRIPNQ